MHSGNLECSSTLKVGKNLKFVFFYSFIYVLGNSFCLLLCSITVSLLWDSLRMTEPFLGLDGLILRN